MTKQEKLTADETIITVTGQQMAEMGWNLNGDEMDAEFNIHINLKDQNIKIAPNVDGADFDKSFEFEYSETLQDLYDADLLPRGIFSGNCLYYNDRNESTSECIQHAAVSQICDMSSVEVAAITSLHQLNMIIDNFSITSEPEFEVVED